MTKQEGEQIRKLVKSWCSTTGEDVRRAVKEWCGK